MLPDMRVRPQNTAPVRDTGGYVLYWMTAQRRACWNFALDRALAWCVELGRPLLVFEALRCDYPYASQRLHRFVMDGMQDNAAAFQAAGAGYLAYVEPGPGAGKGLLARLAERACVVVGDDFPSFFLPHMLAAAANALPIRLEAVDGCGLLPRHEAGKIFHRAVDFRRHLQRTLLARLPHLPRANPFYAGGLPPWQPQLLPDVRPWRPGLREPGTAEPSLDSLPIDRHVGPVALRGGTVAARARLQTFLREGLPRYATDARHPDAGTSSGLSPWLHFGHLAAHEVFIGLTQQAGWDPGALHPPARGQREGWWGLDPNAEAFLDQLLTWRELGYNGATYLDNPQHYTSLPAWSQATLDSAARDPRPIVYSLAQLQQARTHDPLWNAAQRQLLREGVMHNYLRMLWGKKILEWSPTPREALATMLELNDRFALDGRDPNSISGIMWILGRYDRPWGPQRPIFGTVRYMSSANTARKLLLRQYLRQFGDHDPGSSGP